MTSAKNYTTRVRIHQSPDRIPIGVSREEVHEAMREEKILSLQEREGLMREERAGQKKTTIRFPAKLNRKLKAEAAMEGKTFTELVIERLSK